jgi:hypothetical protein
MSKDDPHAVEILSNHFDPFFSFLDKSRQGEDNQLFYICVMISRIFMQRFMHVTETSGPIKIQRLLREHKQGILKGMKFSFEEFHTMCHN